MTEVLKNALSLKQAFVNAEHVTDTEPKIGATLAIDIPIYGTEEEKARLTNIINKLAKSDFGRKTLEIAAAAGYKIDFCKIPGVLGVCSPSKKQISLAPSFTDDRLVGTLAHEARHAGQFERNVAPDIEYDNMKRQIMRTRAMEADAQVAATMTGWELLQQGDAEPFNAFMRDNPLIAKPFMKIAEKEGVESGKAITAAFNGWYDNVRIKEAYENSYYVQRLEWAKNNGIEGELKFEKDDSGNDIVKDICVGADGKGSYYKGDAKQLESGKFLDVSTSTMEYFKEFFTERTEKYGVEPDSSIASIPVRDDYKARSGSKAKNIPDTENDTISQRQQEALKKLAAMKLARIGGTEDDTLVAAAQKTLERIAKSKKTR